MSKISINVLFILITIGSYSQEISQNYTNPDLIKHQVGIGISKFINSAFSSDINAYNVEYRYKYSDKTSFRSGVNYQKDDSETGFIETGIKIGIDRQLKKYTKWTYYYGIDVFGNYSNFKNINKDIFSFGLAPLIGIQYNVSPNFSISIEPMLYVKQNIIVDNSTFELNNKKSWIESGLGKLGYIQLNFHF